MPERPPISLICPAKINLCLAVGPPAPPRGYHPIASWFSAIALHDELTLTRDKPGTGCALTIQWAPDAPKRSPIDWPVEKDLAYRAHQLLQERAGRELPVRATLSKRIPVGGGLGGGSSDAAGMIRGLVRLFDLRITPSELLALGSRLGSDVAFFLDDVRADLPRQALVTGFGERLVRFDGPRHPLILWVPPFACPTAEVYAAYDRLPARPLQEDRVRELVEMACRSGAVSSSFLFNDLAEPAFGVQPELGKLVRTLTGPVFGPVHVTGSGSCAFALMHEPPGPETTRQIATHAGMLAQIATKMV